MLFYFQKRVSTGTRSYHYCPIKNTPFSLVVSLPHNSFRVHAEKEIRRLWSNGLYCILNLRYAETEKMSN